MVKFAGFLKRLKRYAGLGAGVLSGINDFYKNTKSFINPLIGALPGGNVINKGLDIASNIGDKVLPYATTFLNDDDKNKVNKIANDIKRKGGEITNKLVEKHYSLFDEPVNNNLFIK